MSCCLFAVLAWGLLIGGWILTPNQQWIIGVLVVLAIGIDLTASVAS